MDTSFILRLAFFKVAGNEFFGDVSSRFPRLFFVTLPSNEKFERSVGRSSVRYELVDHVGGSVRVLLEVLRCRSVFVFRWSVFGRWGVRYSVRVDAFRGSVAKAYVRAFVFPYYTKRSELSLPLLPRFREPVCRVDVNVIPGSYSLFDLTYTFVEISLITGFRSEKSGVRVLYRIVEMSHVVISLFLRRTCS